MSTPVIIIAQSDLWLRLEIIGVLVAALAIVIGGAVFAVRSLRRQTAEQRWAPVYARARERAEARFGHDLGPMVEIDFPTCSGFLVFSIDTRHRRTLPAREATMLVDALHASNLRNCLVPYHGSFYVPVLSWMSARSQRKSIERQVEESVD